MRLSGRVALVTGAARGIGAAIARAFAAEGARVWLTDIDSTGVKRVAGALGPPARWRVLDVRHEPDWEAVMETLLDEGGRLDVLVNNPVIHERSRFALG